MRRGRTATWRAARRPARSSWCRSERRRKTKTPPAGGVFTCNGSALDTEDLHRLGQRVDRFLVLSGLVQRFAFCTVLLDLFHLRRRQLRLLGERIVDRLHVLRAMHRESGRSGEGKGYEQGFSHHSSWVG